jgi:hypothetical protein
MRYRLFQALKRGDFFQKTILDKCSDLYENKNLTMLTAHLTISNKHRIVYECMNTHIFFRQNSEAGLVSLISHSQSNSILLV